MTTYDPRVEQNTASVIALRDLFRLIISDPEPFIDDVELAKALKSQGRTASLEFEFKDASCVRQVHPLSLNTLKSYANDLFDRGFEGLNDLRIAALDAINAKKDRTKQANKRTKTGLQLNVNELEEKLDHHKKINFLLLQGLSSAINIIKSVQNAPSKQHGDKRADEGLEKLRIIVSMNPPPYDKLFDSSLVINMEKFRDDHE